MKDIKTQTEICREWIDAQRIRSTLYKKRSTYGYKHDVERWAGTYISQDAFNKALDQLGIRRDKDDFTVISRVLIKPSLNRIAHLMDDSFQPTRPSYNCYRFSE
ncbi:hypothetical protein [Acetobacter persici]|uniref:hypothetical protein n=1 Tax=Acetobacter persici TaxID=1076596 RepID=UPI001BA4BDBD|nr:hypothetical protein [Acetobacter persici]MBS1015399.1 hypothetical protein [Acetobacter persici]